MDNRLETRPLKAGRSPNPQAALVAAGRKLFAKHALDAVAINDLIGEARVAKGSFYNHFTDKDALHAAIVKDIRTGIEARIAHVNRSIADPPARIARAICVYAASVSDDVDQGHILLRSDPRIAADEPLNEGMRRDLAAGLHSGRLIIPGIEAGLLFVIGVTHSLLLAAVRDRSRTEAIAQAQQQTLFMLRAFSLPQAEAELIAAQAADDIIRARRYDR